MFREIDWQMVAFVAGSLLQETYVHIPKMYYWDVRIQKYDDDDDDKVA